MRAPGDRDYAALVRFELGLRGGGSFGTGA